MTIVTLADMPTLTELEGLFRVRVTGKVTTESSSCQSSSPTGVTVAANCSLESAVKLTVPIWPTYVTDVGFCDVTGDLQLRQVGQGHKSTRRTDELEELLELDAAAPNPLDAAPDEPEPLEDELPAVTLLDPELTVCPTEPLMAVIVPAAGATRVVPSSAACAEVTAA